MAVAPPSSRPRGPPLPPTPSPPSSPSAKRIRLTHNGSFNYSALPSSSAPHLLLSSFLAPPLCIGFDPSAMSTPLSPPPPSIGSTRPALGRCWSTAPSSTVRRSASPLMTAWPATSIYPVQHSDSLTSSLFLSPHSADDDLSHRLLLQQQKLTPLQQLQQQQQQQCECARALMAAPSFALPRLSPASTPCSRPCRRHRLTRRCHSSSSSLSSPYDSYGHSLSSGDFDDFVPSSRWSLRGGHPRTTAATIRSCCSGRCSEGSARLLLRLLLAHQRRRSTPSPSAQLQPHDQRRRCSCRLSARGADGGCAEGVREPSHTSTQASFVGRRLRRRVQCLWRRPTSLTSSLPRTSTISGRRSRVHRPPRPRTPPSTPRSPSAAAACFQEASAQVRPTTRARRTRGRLCRPPPPPNLTRRRPRTATSTLR